MVRKTIGNYPHGETFDENAKELDRYLYNKEDGSPYLMVKRMEGKRFPQFHYEQRVGVTVNAGNDANWVYGAPKGPKIPYRLPMLVKAPNDSILDILEGEKDADTLSDLGLLSTTCSSSFNGWTDDVTRPCLRFPKLRIHQDNDQAGEEFVHKVVSSFMRCGYQGEITIVNYADMEPGADPSDWIGDTRGKDCDELRKAFLEYCETHSQKWEAPILEEIVLETGHFGKAIDAIEDALVKTFGKTHNIMVRGGALVQPIWEKKPTKKSGDIYITTLKELKVSQLCDILTKRVCIFKKWRKNGKNMELVSVAPPTDILIGLLERGYWKLPYVAGVIQSPTLRPDGTVLWKQGYDPETNLYLGYNGYFKLRPIPDVCSKKHAEVAIDRLKDLLKEFRFVSKLDMAVALSAMITAVTHGAFPICPVHLVVAHNMASGKSYLVDLFSTLATGKKCPVTAYTDTKGDQSENEKRLGALILSGQQMFSLDNLTQNLDGSFLCQVTERPYVSIRVLGQSKMVECEFGGTIYATGNNVGPVNDMIRRTLIIRLDPKSENPEAIRYYSDPIAMVLADRGGYIADILTIAKAYMQSGERVDCHPVASYGDWSRFVREALIWLGEPDVWNSTEEAKQNDIGKSLAHRFVYLWATESYLKVNTPYTIKQICNIVNDIMDPEDGTETLLDVLAQDCAVRGGDPRHLTIDSKKLAGLMRRLNGQIIDGYRIVIAHKNADHGHKWMLERYELAP